MEKKAADLIAHSILKKDRVDYDVLRENISQALMAASTSPAFPKEQKWDGFTKEILYHFVRTTGSQTDVHKAARVLINHLNENP